MNESYRRDFLKAGAIAGEVRAYGMGLIQRGASYNAVVAAILEKIASLGAIPAFPPQIALNHVAAHFLPQPGEDIRFSDEVVKLDVGICWNGAIGDCAVTVDLSGRYQKLIDAAEAALAAAEETVKVGVPVREIGAAIERAITSFGLNPVRNLAGHGLGYYKVHMPPQIPNYCDRSTAVIRPGMTFAIEPFATDGRGLIREEGEATIFSFLKRRPVQAPLARELMEKMKRYSGLPFAIHDFAEDYSLPDLKRGLRELMDAGVIGGYPPLVERVGCRVAQAENSFLVDKDGSVHVTTRV